MELLGLIDVPTWLLLLVTSFILLYIYLSWTHSTWSSLGVVGPKPNAILGTTYNMFKLGAIDAMQEDYNAYKKHKVYGIYNGRVPCLVACDADFIKKILVKEFNFFPNRRPITFEEPLDKMLTVIRDDEWKHARSVISPTFSSGKIKRMMASMNECTEVWMQKLGQKADSKEMFEFKDLCAKFTMDIIGTVAFGLKTNVQDDDNVEFMEHAGTFTNLSKSTIAFFALGTFIPALAPLLKKLGLMRFTPPGTMAYYEAILKQAMETRNSDPNKHTDYLQLLINAKHEFEADGKKGINAGTILANAVIFFIAGFDTVSTTISWVAYNLALNPEVQEKLYDEITKVNDSEDEITLDSLSKMTYLDMVIDESLRLFPPAFLLERQCKETVIIDGITIPKDTGVFIPVYAMHHDADIYPEPEKFIPERMTDEEKAKRNAYHYQPFGLGPRNCVAMRFAQAEVRLAVLKLVQQFKINRCEKTEVPITLKKIGQMHSKNGIYLTVERRY